MPRRFLPVLAIGALGISAWSACAVAKADPQPPQATPPADRPAPPSVPPEVEAVLDRIEAAAKELTTLSAELRYDRIQELLGDKQRRFGQFRYEAGPPAKFDARFDRLIVDKRARKIDLRYTFDGVWLAERNGQDKAFTRRQLVPEGEGGAPVALGESPFVLPLDAKKADILSRFTVALAEPEEGDPESSVHVILTPREGQRMSQVRIDLWYDQKTMLPRRIASLDDSDNRSVIDLTKMQVNQKLSDATFATTPPRGGGWTVQIEPLAEKAPAPKATP